MKYLIIGFIWMPLAFGIDLKEGSYDLISGDDALCETGVIKIRTDEGIDTFTIGSRISFELANYNRDAEVGGCKEIHHVRKNAEEIVTITEFKNCSKKSKKFEDKITRKVVIKNQNVFYEHSSKMAQFKCQYKKSGEK